MGRLCCVTVVVAGFFLFNDGLEARFLFIFFPLHVSVTFVERFDEILKSLHLPLILPLEV